MTRFTLLETCSLRRLTFVAATLAAMSFVPALAQQNPAAAPAPAANNPAITAPVSQSAPMQITKLTNKTGNTDVTAELGDNLVVVLNSKPPADATHYVLFLNGLAVDDLEVTQYDTANQENALAFHLQRTDKNAATWKALLGAPTELSRPISVALGERASNDQPVKPTITGPKGQQPIFAFEVIPPVRLLFATVFIGAVFVIVWGTARRSATLKDNLIPQIDPARQTYSLARWQMAFWFTLVFASYVLLYIILGDANTLSNQALMLMGISGATALAAVAVDAAKDTPADAVNAGLRLLGIKNYTDIDRINAEIADRQKRLASTPPASAQVIAQLNSEILDRQLLLQNYEDAIKGFVSEGWFKDIVTDLNGTALHRLQVLCWTSLLGVIFLIDVWHDLTMPQFSDTLLALMAVSGAGYVGFKYPEAQQ